MLDTDKLLKEINNPSNYTFPFEDRTGKVYVRLDDVNKIIESMVDDETLAGGTKASGII